MVRIKREEATAATTMKHGRQMETLQSVLTRKNAPRW